MSETYRKPAVSPVESVELVDETRPGTPRFAQSTYSIAVAGGGVLAMLAFLTLDVVSDGALHLTALQIANSAWQVRFMPESSELLLGSRWMLTLWLVPVTASTAIVLPFWNFIRWRKNSANMQQRLPSGILFAGACSTSISLYIGYLAVTSEHIIIIRLEFWVLPFGATLIAVGAFMEAFRPVTTGRQKARRAINRHDMSNLETENKSVTNPSQLELLLELDQRWFSHPGYLCALLCSILLVFGDVISEDNGNLGRLLVKTTAIVTIGFVTLAVHRDRYSNSDRKIISTVLVVASGLASATLTGGALLPSIGYSPGSAICVLGITAGSYIEYHLLR